MRAKCFGLLQFGGSPLAKGKSTGAKKVGAKKLKVPLTHWDDFYTQKSDMMQNLNMSEIRKKTTSCIMLFSLWGVGFLKLNQRHRDDCSEHPKCLLFFFSSLSGRPDPGLPRRRSPRFQLQPHVHIWLPGDHPRPAAGELEPVHGSTQTQRHRGKHAC